MGARTALSWTLARLSTWAINKHDMKLLVVAGRHGTKRTGELIADMLSPDLVVRRQLEKPFWEYSIPLAILGFEDRRYTPVEWSAVIIRSIAQLLLRGKNPTWTILQMNTYKDDIVRYWADIIRPEILVLVHPDREKREIEEHLISKTGRYVVAPSIMEISMSAVQRGVTVHRYGEEEDADLQVMSFTDRENGTTIQICGVLVGKKEECFVFQRGAFMREPLAAAMTVLFLLSFSMEEISEKMRQTQLDLERFIFTAQ
jgi:hypothetical protein